jgi:hypothetical protein
MEHTTTAPPADLSDWLAVIKGEFREMPGLQLTKSQVQRMWGLDAAACDILLETLQATRFLRLTARGCYALADDAVGGPGWRPSPPSLVDVGETTATRVDQP